MQQLNRVMGLNVILGVFAYRGLLTFQPVLHSEPVLTLASDVEAFFFTPSQTAPLVVVMLSLWILFHRRVELFSLPNRGGPIWLAALMMVSSLAIFAWSIYTKSADLQGLSLIATLAGIAVLWRGLPAVRVALVPLFLLLYAVPPPTPLLALVIWEFQIMTAQLSGWFLYLLGIPVFISGEMIKLPLDTFQVIESCSGLRSVETLTMLSIMMSDLFGRGRRHVVILFLLAMPIAFFMNGIRVLTLILNPHSAIHSIHIAQGILVLLGGVMLLYMVDGQLARILPGRTARVAHPDANSRQPQVPELHRALAVTGLLAALLIIANFFPVWSYSGLAPAGRLEQNFARSFDRFGSSKVDTGSGYLGSVSFRESIRWNYSIPEGLRRDGRLEPDVEVFVGISEHLNRYGSPFSPKTALPGRGWTLEKIGVTSLEGTEAEITWRLLRSETQRVITYHWYEEHRGLLSESLRNFFALDRSPLARDLPIVVVRLSTEVQGVSESEIASAHERLERFQAFVHPELEALKQRLAGKTENETSGLLIFPLREKVFPSRLESMERLMSEIKGLRSA